MSRVAYLDCSAGAAGDTLLGALVELGLPLEALAEELRKLPLEGYRFSAVPVKVAGMGTFPVRAYARTA